MSNYICGMCEHFHLSNEYKPFGVCEKIATDDDLEFAVVTENDTIARACDDFSYAITPEQFRALYEKYGL